MPILTKAQLRAKAALKRRQRTGEYSGKKWKEYTFYGRNKEFFELKGVHERILAGSAETGKDAPLDSIIMTPTGEIRMGDIAMGDRVCTPDGGEARVIGIYPQGQRDVYRITFAEGDYVECSEEHLWKVGYAGATVGTSHAERTREEKWKVMPLKDFRHRYLSAGKKRRKFWLPITQPVTFDTREVPLDPYLLGALLGDGGITHSVMFSTVDAYILDRVKDAVKEHGCQIKYGSKCDYRIVRLARSGRNSIKDILSDLGLFGHGGGTKFVPELYKVNSIHVRREVLRGLMDTDGSIGKKGSDIEYSSISPQLAKDVKWLVESLGGLAKINSFISASGKETYRLRISIEDGGELFSLPRKKARSKPRSHYHVNKRMIAKIEYVGKKETQCIAVDHPDMLYLMDNFTVTHNTFATLYLLNRICWEYPGTQAALVRKTYKSMPGSVLQTLERRIFPVPTTNKRTPIQPYGGKKPEQYIYPNGSVIWVGGMDNPDKVLSSERHIICVNQAEELGIDDWEKLITRATGRGEIVYSLETGEPLEPFVMGDCNPGAATHWIKRREADKKLTLINSRHRDNPTLYDPKTGEITVQGQRTMAILNNLTGVRRSRLKDGLWVSAEGQVYEDFDPQVHIIDAFPLPTDARYIRGIDFGYKNPFVCLWGFVMDKDLYIYRQYYRTQLTVSDHHRKIWKLSKNDPCPFEVTVADHDAEDRATMEQTELIKDGADYVEIPGIPTIAADKRVLYGIDLVRERLKTPIGETYATKHTPRIFIFRDSLVDPDKDLTASYQAACLEDEFGAYIYPEGAGKKSDDMPIKKNDHALDPLRYMVAYLDAGDNIDYSELLGETKVSEFGERWK